MEISIQNEATSRTISVLRKKKVTDVVDRIYRSVPQAEVQRKVMVKLTKVLGTTNARLVLSSVEEKVGTGNLPFSEDGALEFLIDTLMNTYNIPFDKAYDVVNIFEEPERVLSTASQSELSLAIHSSTSPIETLKNAVTSLVSGDTLSAAMATLDEAAGIQSITTKEDLELLVVILVEHHNVPLKTTLDIINRTGMDA